MKPNRQPKQGMKFEVEIKVFGKTMRTTVDAKNEDEAWAIAHRAASNKIQRVNVKRVKSADVFEVFEDIFGTPLR